MLPKAIGPAAHQRVKVHCVRTRPLPSSVMDQHSDGPVGDSWATAHPALHALALALEVAPPVGRGLRAALVEQETWEIWEHTDLGAQQPQLVVAALVEADRTGSQDLLGGILNFLNVAGGLAPLVGELVARDESLAFRCIPRLVAPEDSLTHAGALTTLRSLAAELSHPSPLAFGWDIATVWGWPPQRLWQLLLVADERFPRPVQDLDGLYRSVFELAPTPVFGADPHDGDEAEADVRAHVQAFVQQAAAVAAAGGDTAAWTRWIGQHQQGCGEPWCCRPSRFEAELRRQGFQIRLARTPWT